MNVIKTERHQQKIQMTKVRNLWFVIPLVVGVFVANQSIPLLHRYWVSDYVRTQLILTTLKQPPVHLHTAIFGSSITMSGINTRLIHDPDAGRAIYNFASTGQTIPETLLYFPIVSAPIEHVVQFVTADELTTSPELSEQVLRNFRLYGYDTSDVAVQLLTPLDISYLNKPAWQIYTDSRGFLSDQIDRSARRLLRTDLNLASISRELYYPNTYTRRLDPAKYQVAIERFNPVPPRTVFEPNETSIMLLKKAATYFKEKEIRYTVIVNPINPDLDGYTEAYRNSLADWIKQTNAPDFRIINMSSLLGSQDFVDHWHPSASGANRLSLATKVILEDQN